MTSVASTGTQQLRAALLWAGERSAAAGRSAAAQYGLEGVHAAQPEIVLPRDVRGRTPGITVSHADPASQMIRTVRGIRTTGIEATLLRLAHLGRRWDHDATDYRRDQRKWSIPARHGFRLVFATWSDVAEHPGCLVASLRAALMS